MSDKFQCGTGDFECGDELRQARVNKKLIKKFFNNRVLLICSHPDYAFLTAFDEVESKIEVIVQHGHLPQNIKGQMTIDEFLDFIMTNSEVPIYNAGFENVLSICPSIFSK